jgi:hypothetical protein
MAFNGSDHIMISRAGALYKVTGSEILAFFKNNAGTGEYRVADIAARNALDGQMTLGDRVIVNDATGDATVTAGWAIYAWLSSNTWQKQAEQESLDINMAGTNLTYTAGPANGIVVSDSGTDATIPSVDAVNAGLMLSSHKTKLDFMTVSAATDLDAIRAASHAAVTLVGAVNNNPLTLNGQQLGFSIANLTTAP